MLTFSQRKALDHLKSSRPFVVTPARTIQPRNRFGTSSPIAYPAVIKTGVNTTTLHNLREMGLIACTKVYLSGETSVDLTITELGETA